MAAFEPVKRMRAYESVVDQIRDAIYQRELRPGERLPSERELMKQFGVGRSTVREALRVLEAAGLVKSLPGDPRGGAQVQAFTPDTLRSALLSLIHLEDVPASHLVEFRMLIEGEASQLAAHFRTDEQLAEIERLHQQITQHAEQGDEEAFRAADAALHRQLALSAGNALIQACSEVIREIVLTLIEQKLASSEDTIALMKESAERHGLIVAAIGDQDGVAAAARAKQDILDYYGKHLSDDAASRLRFVLDDEGSAAG